MNHAHTIEIEFPTSGPNHTAAIQAMSRLEDNLDTQSFHVEPLVRTQGRLFGAYTPYAAAAGTYVMRIYIDALADCSRTALNQFVIQPLLDQSIEVRQVELTW